MKTNWRRFAPVGLYLALVAALASAGLYIVQRSWNLPLQISLGGILIGLAIFSLLDPEKVREILTGRQARYGSNALVLSLAFVGIVVVVNYLVFGNNKRWDLTEDKQFTLASETLDTLKNLKDPVKALAFFTPRTNSDQAKSLLDQFKYYSNGKFTYEFIDPEANPVAAEQAKVSRDGTVVLTMSGRQQAVTFVSEQELASALVRLMNPESRTIYFLTGHGELNPEEAGDQSVNQAKRTLESKNYAVKSLNLLATNQVPDDASVIVVAGPQKPLSENEVSLLKTYVEKGKSLIVLEEPTPVTQFGESPDPLAGYLKDSWGISLDNDFVIDPSSNQLAVAVGSQWGDHMITSKLKGYAVVMPSSRSVTVEKGPTGVTQVTLVSTSNQAWGETDLTSLQAQSVKKDSGADIMGPVPLAVAAENMSQKSRVVVFGNSIFITDQWFFQLGNGDLFVNSVDWAAGEESLINLTPKSSTKRVVIPPERVSLNLILLGMVFILPGLALVSGIVVWIQGRRRG